MNFMMTPSAAINIQGNFFITWNEKFGFYFGGSYQKMVIYDFYITA